MMEIKREHADNTTKLGARLRRAREQARLSQQEVAQQLRLTAKIIDALEQEQYEQLVAASFAKGYLRLYAKLLGLPVVDIIDAYHQLGYPDTVVSTLSHRPKKVARVKISKILTATLLLSITLTLAGWILMPQVWNIAALNPVLKRIELALYTGHLP